MSFVSKYRYNRGFWLFDHGVLELTSFMVIPYTPNSKSLKRAWSRGIVDRTKEYSFVLSTKPRLRARSRLLELAVYLSKNKSLVEGNGRRHNQINETQHHTVPSKSLSKVFLVDTVEPR